MLSAAGWALALLSAPCPAARELPQLTLAEIEEPAVPVIDRWQVMWDGVALSDAQVAELSGEQVKLDRMRAEMESRGVWVYLGMGIAAVGAALSSTGWVLYGQNELPQGVTVPLAAGGLLVGVLGVLMVTANLQEPLEPFLAPTPVHRLTREEAVAAVERINRDLYRGVCDGAEASAP